MNLQKINPLNWEPGILELLISAYFLVSAIFVAVTMEDQINPTMAETVEYYALFTLAMLMSGIATIRVDIYKNNKKV